MDGGFCFAAALVLYFGYSAQRSIGRTGIWSERPLDKQHTTGAYSSSNGSSSNKSTPVVQRPGEVQALLKNSPTRNRVCDAIDDRGLQHACNVRCSLLTL